MKGQLLSSAAVLALAVACAPAAQPPAPEIPQPTPSVVRPPFRMDSALTADRVPAFQESALIAWGPPPEGTAHPERARRYDLQNQVTTVRFDWPRQAVVGSTTLTIAGLPDAEPLSTVMIDAGDMTFRHVTSDDKSLKYDYDGSVLTIRLPSALRAGQKMSITIDYDGANRSKGAYFRPAKHIVWTQGETQDNHFWVPTYDFPNDKTTWEFYIWTAKDERALS
ncbi:MAG TPA: hypothetical protein VIH53_04220, partial [Gemmatimonadaceae bacterium]